MITTKNHLQTEVVGSEDGTHTYEIRRAWGEGRKALVIELYPAVSTKKSGYWDLSAMHLMNHANELGWGEMRILNLYSNVFLCKPSVKELKSDVENTAYIRDILEGEEARDYDIVIAWGSSLATHAGTIRVKAEILEMLKEKGLEKQTKHIVTDSLDTNGQTGTHPLYLGLRHAKEIWKLQPYPLEKLLEELKKNMPRKLENSSKTNDKETKEAVKNQGTEEQKQTIRENLPNPKNTDKTEEDISKAEEPAKDMTETEHSDKREAKPKKGRKKDVLQNQEPA